MKNFLALILCFIMFSCRDISEKSTIYPHKSVSKEKDYQQTQEKKGIGSHVRKIKEVVVEYGILMAERSKYNWKKMPVIPTNESSGDYYIDLFLNHPNVMAIYQREDGGRLFGLTEAPPNGLKYLKFYKQIDEDNPSTEVQQSKGNLKNQDVQIISILWASYEKIPQPIGIGHIFESLWDYVCCKE